MELFEMFLKDEIHERYKTAGYFDFHLIKQFHNDSKKGAFLIASRKAMTSNINQRPLVVAQHTQSNKLGLPLYYPIQQTETTNNKPRSIVYIGSCNNILLVMFANFSYTDISINSTCVVCKTVDSGGRTIQNIHVGDMTTL
jgi:hypothetical protein